MKYKPFDLKKISTYPLSHRKNKITVQEFSRLPKGNSISEYLEILPKCLAGETFQKILEALREARRKGHPVVMAMGGHVIKVGLSPLLIALMDQGWITGFVMHGATAIHDFEISLIGATSEWVDESLPKGTFGMAEETALAFSRGAKKGSQEKKGLGRAMGELILEDKNPYSEFSILAAAAKRDLPCTIHVAIGTDIVHMHPLCSGSDLGESSHLDFQILCSLLKDMEEGVWLNVGSAVVLPEIFLKALSVAINTGSHLQGLTTVNMDMIHHYRPSVNVLSRPPGKSLSLTGHHELLIPLLYMALGSGEEKE